eukprot:2941366-Pleurochrysis_carterae.AAC.1
MQVCISSGTKEPIAPMVKSCLTQLDRSTNVNPRSANQKLAQLEERGLVEKLGEAVGHLVARADRVRFDSAVELALAQIVIPALVVLSLLRGAGVVSWFNCRGIVHEQDSGTAVEL